MQKEKTAGAVSTRKELTERQHTSLCGFCRTDVQRRNPHAAARSGARAYDCLRTGQDQSTDLARLASCESPFELSEAGADGCVGPPLGGAGPPLDDLPGRRFDSCAFCVVDRGSRGPIGQRGRTCRRQRGLSTASYFTTVRLTTYYLLLTTY